MAKLTTRTVLATTPADGDLVHIVDVSDSTDDPAGTSKQITRANLVGGLGVGDMVITTYDAAGVSEQLVGLTASQTLTNKTIDADNNTITNLAIGAEVTGASTALSDTADLTYNADTDVSANGWVVDEDDMASDLNTKVPTQQSVKAYVDTSIIADDQTAAEVPMDELGTATYDDVQDWSNTTQSAGAISGGSITDGGSGTIDVSAITGVIKTTNDEVGANVFFDFAGATGETLTDGNTNYVAIDYNAGTPQLVIDTSNTANGHTIFNLGKVYREGTSVDIIDSGLHIEDFAKRVSQHHVEQTALEFVSGAVVSETGTQNIAISAGVMYAALNRIVTDAIDTSVADDFEYYYYDGDLGTPAWVESDATDIDNLQYNDVATGLATLSAQQYGVHWVYKGTGTSTYVVYGQDSYTLTEAQSAQPPTSLPPHVSGFGVLRAKIIIQKSATTFTDIERVDDISFSSGSASNHNELAGLDGGAAGEYYHATSAEYTVLQNTSGTNTGDQTLPVKATGAELDTGTDDAKFATAKAIVDSKNVPSVVPGTSGNVLTSDGTDWTSAAAGGGGQTLYDYVLDASGGGDFTDWSTAMTALGDNESLFVRAGLYNETTPFTNANNDITIIGENPYETTLLMNGSASVTWTGNNITFKNIGIKNAASGYWYFSGNYVTMDGCYVQMNATTNSDAFRFSGSHASLINSRILDDDTADNNKINFTGMYPIFSNNQVKLANLSGSTSDGWLSMAGFSSLCSDNMFEITSTTSGGAVMEVNNGTANGNFMYSTNSTTGIGIIVGSRCIATGNLMYGFGTGIIMSSSYGNATGNIIYGGGAGSIGVDVNSSYATITGNTLVGTVTTGGSAVDVNGDNCTITGNTMYAWGTCVTFASGSDNNVLTGNNMSNATTILSDSGTDNVVSGNVGV